MLQYKDIYERNYMPIHCHSCTCTKTTLNRQYGPDPKFIKLVVNEIETIINIKHPLYMLRYSILTRCYNAKQSEYNAYQGKGIQVCDAWKQDPISFYEWCLKNGWEKGMTIDRIDPNGHYEPNNCQFLTRTENNKKAMRQNPVLRNVKLNKEKAAEIRSLLSDGIPGSELAKRFGVCKSTIYNIKNHGLWA